MAPGWRFAIAILVVTALFVALGIGLALRNYRDERQQKLDETRQTAINAGLNADRLLSDQLNVLLAIALAPTVRAGDQPGMLAYFQSLDLDRIGFGGGIGWVDANGISRVSTTLTSAQLPLDIHDRPYIQAVIASKQPYVGDAVIGRESGNPLLPLAVPIFDNQGAFSGILVASIRLDILESATKERRFGTDDLIIIDRAGNVIARSIPITNLDNVAGNPLLTATVGVPLGLLEDATSLDGNAGRIIAFAAVPTGGWTILIDRSVGQVLGSARNTLWWEISGLLSIGLAGALATFWLARRINRAAAREALALDALSVREARLSALTEATTQVIWTANRDGELREPDLRWKAITGIPGNELDHSTWLPYVHPDDRQRGHDAWDRGLRNGTMVEFAQRVKRADGAERHFLVRAVPVFGDDGVIQEWIGVDIDVTEQRRAEANLRETAERLSLALAAGQFSTWEWDVLTDRMVWSESAPQWVGAAPSNLAEFEQRLHLDDRDRVRAAMRRALDDGSPFEIEYRIPLRDGRVRWISTRGEAFIDAAGSPTRVLGVGMDITDRKNREEFEQAFVASVAHDIKNPLAAVKAQAQLLWRRLRNGRADTENIDAVLEAVDAGLAKMNRRIAELQDVARLRAGSLLELRAEPTDLHQIVRAVVASYQQATEGHTLIVESDNASLVGQWDSSRIDRVVDNLVSNAIKYSPKGGEIVLGLRREPGSPPSAVLTVVDHGIGIPAADLPYIFERYRRAGNTTVISGAGIGLAGARQIVEQHGGHFEVESEEGVGSRFTVYLPLAGE